MRRQQWLIAGLVGVIASLVTLLVVDVTGSRQAYAQDSAQTGYLAVVAGPLVRNRSIPLIVVDTQAMAIMTYDLEVTGTYNTLTLTCVRSFKFDRKMIEYNHKNHARPFEPPKSAPGYNTVQEMMDAAGKQRRVD